MLLLHEVHKVAGTSEEAFDAAYRDEYLPILGQAMTRDCCGTYASPTAVAPPTP